MARKPSLPGYLRNARIKHGFSVAELAEHAGVSVASVYLWETDKTRPQDANLFALHNVLKLPVRATREVAVRWPPAIYCREHFPSVLYTDNSVERPGKGGGAASDRFCAPWAVTSLQSPA
jgi:transcriptional regulator with XRE-family HTH domain